MKKMILALVMVVMTAAQANAMSYEQARRQALFLTDKMAYELNLTEDQYEAAYEVNLDYLMSIDDYRDLYGIYWRQRNLDLSYILFDWQYRVFCDASYFYRPLYYTGGYWHFGIYARYPRRDYFYFGYPSFVNVYVGGHSWGRNGGRSWYRGRDWRPRPDDRRPAMRDGFNRGDFGRGNQGPQKQNVYRTFGNGNRGNLTQSNAGTRAFGGSAANGRSNNGNVQNGNSSFGGSANGGTRSFGTPQRQSSTRSTVTSPATSNGGHFGGRSVESTTPRSTFTPQQRTTTTTPNRSFATPQQQTVTRIPSTRSNRNFGGSRSQSTRRFSTPSRSTQSIPSRSFSTPSRSTQSAPSRSYSAPSRSFGGSSSAPSRSFSQPSRSFGGSGSSNGGGHFGGRR